MNRHAILDKLTIYTSLALLAKSKYFRETTQSESVAEHITAVHAPVPPITGKGLCCGESGTNL